MADKTHNSQGDATEAPELNGRNDFGKVDKNHPCVFNKNQVMKLLGISPIFIERLVRDGAPLASGGNGSNDPWAVHLPSFFRFILNDAKKSSKGDGGKMSLDEAKRKDKEVQSSIREMELLKLQGEMVEIESVRPFLREVLSTTRSRMLSVPSQIMGLSPSQQRDLQDAINDALGELSEGRAGEWNPDKNKPADDEAADQHAHH